MRDETSAGDEDVPPSTRERFITATNELFRRQGFHGTSLKQVTGAAGAPIGSLYHHFPGGKDELTGAVLASSGAVYQELFELIWDAADDPGAGVRDFFEGAALVLEETDFIDPCPIGSVAREVASTNDELRQAAHRVFENWIGSLTARLEQEGLGQSVAHDLATTLVGAVEGGFVIARTAKDATILRTSGRQMARVVESAVGAAQSQAGGGNES